jgi:hypothetical protein
MTIRRVVGIGLLRQDTWTANPIANFLIRHRFRRSIEFAPAVDELPAIIAVRPAARNRFVGFVYNRNHVLAYKIDGPSAEAAEGLTVR